MLHVLLCIVWKGQSYQNVEPYKDYVIYLAISGLAKRY